MDSRRRTGPQMIAPRRALVGPSRTAIALVAALAACASPKMASTPDFPVPGRSTGDAKSTLSVDQLQAVRAHTAGCWYFDPGADRASLPVVEIHVVLRPDGSVQSAAIIDEARMATDAS